MGLSRRLLDCSPSTIALTALSVLCNPEFDPPTPLRPGQPEGTDPRNWHRDIRPDHVGPLSALLDDIEANGPAYAQWNIALCDEAILHLVPGSHRRLNSGPEADQLKRHGGTQMPLPNEIAADLKAGDGVVYNVMLLHWGAGIRRRNGVPYTSGTGRLARSSRPRTVVVSLNVSAVFSRMTRRSARLWRTDWRCIATSQWSLEMCFGRYWRMTERNSVPA